MFDGERWNETGLGNRLSTGPSEFLLSDRLGTADAEFRPRSRSRVMDSCLGKVPYAG